MAHACFEHQSNHLCDKYDKYNYKTQFNAGHTVSSGGIVTISVSQYSHVNGHPNRYWGWGGEDHEGALRFRSYDSDKNPLVSNGLKKSDPMNEYILGIDRSGGDVGMVRADKYGYYTQLKHGRGFTNSQNALRFYKNVNGFRDRPSRFRHAGWIAVDGLNTLFYNSTKIEYRR